jgi:hypothetical protein
MMSLGQLNAAVALPLSLPAQLQQSLQGSPLEAALNLAGVKVGSCGLVPVHARTAAVPRTCAPPPAAPWPSQAPGACCCCC